MKYTFEIMKEYEDAFKGISVYSVSEDKKLMVDFVALEELEDAQKEIDEAYKKGYDKGYTDKTNNDEVGKELVKDVYQKGYNDGKEYGLDESDMREAVSYQKGLDDAWEAARKLFSSMADSDIERVFPTEWYNGGFNALINLQPQKVIEKLKAYEEKQEADDQIKVRDEVVWKQDGNVVMVVTRVYMVEGFEWCDGICKDGKVYSILTKNARKTGRQFDIDKILEEMKE